MLISMRTACSEHLATYATCTNLTQDFAPPLLVLRCSERYDMFLRRILINQSFWHSYLDLSHVLTFFSVLACILFACCVHGAFKWTRNPFPKKFVKKFTRKVSEICFDVDEGMLEYFVDKKCGYEAFKLCMKIESEGETSMGMSKGAFVFVHKPVIEFTLPMFCDGEHKTTTSGVGKFQSTATYKDERLECEAHVGEFAFENLPKETKGPWKGMARILPDLVRKGVAEGFATEFCRIVECVKPFC